MCMGKGKEAKIVSNIKPYIFIIRDYRVNYDY